MSRENINGNKMVEFDIATFTTGKANFAKPWHYFHYLLIHFQISHDKKYPLFHQHFDNKMEKKTQLGQGSLYFLISNFQTVKMWLISLFPFYKNANN